MSPERDGLLTGEDVARRVAALSELPIRTDRLPDLEVAMALAQHHGLSYYDALYVELAQRLDGELLSFNDALLRVAEKERLRALAP